MVKGRQGERVRSLSASGLSCFSIVDTYFSRTPLRILEVFDVRCSYFYADFMFVGRSWVTRGSSRTASIFSFWIVDNIFQFHNRSKSNQYPNTSLIQIEGVNTKEEVDWYRGKRMAYIYKAKVKKNGSHYRCIWGKAIRPHGNSGVVRAKFKSNLPPKSMVNAIAGSVHYFIYVG